MRTLLLPELADKTFVALKEAGASSYYQTTFQTVARQFIRYATEKDAQTFSMDLGLQFLEDHYSMLVILVSLGQGSYNIRTTVSH